jgi:hypothetical protein
MARLLMNLEHSFGATPMVESASLQLKLYNFLDLQSR